MQAYKMLPSSKLVTRIPLGQSSSAPALLGVAARSGPSRQLALTLRAAKGFGKTKPPARKSAGSSDDEDGPSTKSRKQTKRIQLQQTALGPIPGQQQSQAVSTGGPPQGQLQLLDTAAPVAEDDTEFLARLEQLKLQSKEKAAAAAAVASGDPTAIVPAVFDAPAPVPRQPLAANADDDIYANPPTLSQTLTQAMAEKAGVGVGDLTGISDPALRNAQIGPSQLGLAVGAIVFVAVFLIVAAGDYAPASRRYEGVRAAQAPPDPIEEKILKSKVARYEDELKASPTDDDVATALASSYARLLQYDKAAGVYEKVAKRNPDNADAWRLLGESSLLSQQPRKAVTALERAVQLRGQPDLQLLTGLVDAYVAAGEYGKAVDSLNGVRQKLQQYQEEQRQLAAAAAAAAATVVVPAAAVAASDGDASSSSSSSSSSTEVGTEAASTVTPAVLAAAPPALLTAPELTDDGAVASTSSTAQKAAAAAEAVAPSAAPPAAVQPLWDLDPVGLDLLTGKVYTAWRGHEQDALATYDRLIKTFPEDYRGYLAKGLVLKEQGRKADAERMFLQARFYAPSSMQQVVRAIAESSPVRDLPSN